MSKERGAAVRALAAVVCARRAGLARHGSWTSGAVVDSVVAVVRSALS
jgi:hypothetical protein